MKKTSNLNFIFGMVILLVCVGFFSHYLSKADNTNSSSKKFMENSSNSHQQTQSNVGGGDIQTELEIKYPGRIFYTKTDSEKTEVFSLSANGSEKKKIFTDADEETKIKGSLSVTNDGKNILVLMAPKEQEFGGSLYFISTDGKGTKTKLIEEFASTQSAVISPDGQLIAYILFSNIESDYGFSLYTMNTQGGNKTKLTDDPAGISNVAWNKNSKSLSFVKGNNPSKSIDTISAEGKNLEAIYQLPENQTINYLSYSEKLLFSQSSVDKNQLNQAEIYLITKKGEKPIKLTENESHDNYVIFSPSGEYFCFLTTNADLSKALIYQVGDIFLAKSDGSGLKKLTEANTIIGWTD